MFSAVPVEGFEAPTLSATLRIRALDLLLGKRNSVNLPVLMSDALRDTDDTCAFQVPPIRSTEALVA